MSEEYELLFFDTFSHDAGENLNLDLVQFPCTVLIHEVRVIPLGTKVEVDVPGGIRLGATNPSTFKLELFANNRRKKDAPTFERLGILEYEANVDIQFIPTNQIPTDGLILKGWYTTLTLAIYGTLTKVIPREQSPPPPPPPPQPRSKPVVDPVAAAPAAQLLAKPSSSSLTPSDLPSLPSSKKVHKWLADSTRTSVPPVPGVPTATAVATTPRSTVRWHESGSTPQQDAEQSPHHVDHAQSTARPDGGTPAPVPSLNQVELAREIIQVLGSVAAQTLEHSKLLNQQNLNQTGDQPATSQTDVPPPPVNPSTYRECADTPASPPRADHHDDACLDPRPPGSRGTVTVSAVGEDSPHNTIPSSQTPICDASPMEVAEEPRTDWKPQRDPEPPGFISPIQTRLLSLVSGATPLPMPAHPVVDQREIEDPDADYQNQAGHSPRDIPLEQSGRIMDPRLNAGESPGDPRESSHKELREIGEPDQSHRGSSLERSRGGRKSRSRSRSRSLDRDIGRRTEQDWDGPREEMSESHKETIATIFDHDLDSYEDGNDPVDKDAEKPRDWPTRDKHNKPASVKDVERDREVDKERTSREDRERPKDDRSRSRDKERDRSRDFDRDRAREPERGRTAHSERDRDKDRRESDRDRDRNRDRDRPRLETSSRDRPDSRNEASSRDRPDSRTESSSRDKADPERDRSRRDSDKDKFRDETDSHSRDKDWPSKNRPDDVTSGRDRDHSKDDEYERDRSRGRDKNQDSKESKTVEIVPKLARSVKSRSPSPCAESPPIYQEVDMVGLSPGVDIFCDPNADLDTPTLLTEEDDIYSSLPMDTAEPGLSDGEIQEAEAYSDISSDDNILEVDKIGDWGDYEIDDAWNLAIPTFNPYQCYITPLETFSNPALTEYEVQKQRMILARSRSETQVMPAEAKSILAIVEAHKDQPHHDRWIEALEGIPALLAVGLSYMVNRTNNREVLDTLIDWALEGLDRERAIQQPETVYMVRHLKMGIRLTAALCSCDSYIAFRMMSKDVQQKLLDLFTSEYMSSSVKLQIIRALDSSTRLKEGLDWFLGRHRLQLDEKQIEKDLVQKRDVKLEPGVEYGAMENKEVKLTAYQRLLEIIMQKQVVRVTVAISALMKKVHLYEVLWKLNANVHLLIDSVPVPDPKPTTQGTTDTEDAEIMDIADPEPPLILDSVNEEDIENIVECLNEASRFLKNAENLIGQPKRGLPNEIVFSVAPRLDAIPGLYHMFNSSHLMESLFMLLSSPATCNHTGIFSSIREMLQRLTGCLHGLLYLSHQTEDVLNGIIRTLIQSPATSEYSQDDDREQHPAHQLGQHMIYVLQTLQHVDQLRLYHSKDKEQKCVDDADALVVLQALYTMTFNPQGRDALVYVLGLENNVNIFMPFIEVTGEADYDQRMRKSVCYSYSIMFLIMMLRYLDRADWLLKAGPTLLLNIDPGEHGSAKMVDKLSEIQDYLAPIKKCPNFTDDSIMELITLLKAYNDDIQELPKGLVTVLRILKQLCIAPSNTDKGCVVELKYQYAVIQVFSADCMPVFYNILQKIGDLALSPWQMGFPQNSHSRAVILGIVQPVLDIMKAIITNLIAAKGPEFKDLTCLQSLLHLHTVLCSWSHTGTLATALQQVQNTIVEIILAFTQPVVQGEDSGDALAKSLWTLAMKEILTYVLVAPYTFLSGLILVSELLPLPLPIQAKEALSPDEVMTAVNNRKLWSAHLHPLSTQIQEIIRSLAGSLCHPLQQVIRRVCWQLTDLAVPTAVTVTRCLLDMLLEQMDQTRDHAVANLDPDQKEAALRAEVNSSGETSRILSLMSFLMNQAPFKAAFLAVTQPGSMGESRYLEVIPRLVTLLNVVSESPAHTHAQENIVSILQCLCDLDVSLYAGDNAPFHTQLANSLPGSETLNLICAGLMQHMSHQDHKFSSILPSLRTLAMLMDHDYGFYHVKSAMEKVSTAFFNLFMQINITFSKDSSDCIATLSSAAECIQFLVSLPMSLDVPDAVDRTYTMSLAEVRELLGWSSEAFAHPLDDLDKLLCEYAKEEETLKAVYESVNTLVNILKAEEDESQPRPEIVEPKLPTTETLTNQFGQRSIYTLTDDEDDRLSATYWLATPMLDDLEFDTDLIPCDFEEMVQKYAADFDLKSEVEKGSLPSEITATKMRMKRRRGQDTINTSRMRGNRGSFVAPMRGRGFGRAMNNKTDQFRSRPPNTSRPPSMHVDDFVKMENQGNSSMPQSGNQRQQRADRDGGRGHGFDRGGRGFFGSGRGGHFSRSGGNTGGYNRREQGRGGNNQRGGFGFHGNMTGGNRGGSTQRGGRGNNMRGNATSRGSPMGTRGSPVKNPSPWRTRQQGSYRGFGRGDGRAGSSDRADRRRDSVGSSRFGRGRGTGWSDKGKDRFMPSGGGFHRRDRGGGGGSGGGGGGGNHRRAFTK